MQPCRCHLLHYCRIGLPVIYDYLMLETFSCFITIRDHKTRLWLCQFRWHKITESDCIVLSLYSVILLCQVCHYDGGESVLRQHCNFRLSACLVLASCHGNCLWRSSCRFVVHTGWFFYTIHNNSHSITIVQNTIQINMLSTLMHPDCFGLS